MKMSRSARHIHVPALYIEKNQSPWYSPYNMTKECAVFFHKIALFCFSFIQSSSVIIRHKKSSMFNIYDKETFQIFTFHFLKHLNFPVSCDQYISVGAPVDRH